MSESKELKVRKLSWGDTFKLSKILKKMNLKIDASEIAKNIDPEDLKTGTMSLEKAGLQAMIPIFLQALENLHQAEPEVNEFLGSLVGITGEEFGKLPIEDGIAVIGQLAGQKGVSDFLKSAGQ